MAVCGVDDVDISPYERARGRGKRSLGFGASRVFVRVGTVLASHSWTRGEGKGGTESKSKGDSEHLGWEGSLSREEPCRTKDGKVAFLYMQLSILFDNERVSYNGNLD